MRRPARRRTPERRKPFGRKIFDEPLAQDDLRLLIEPGLRDIEDEQDPSQLGEDAELREKLGHVPVRQRVVERLVPGVQPNLRVGRCAHHRQQGDDQQNDLDPLARLPQRRGQAHHLRGEAVFGRRVAECGVMRVFSRFRHDVASFRVGVG